MAQPLAVSYKEIMTHLDGLSRLASSVEIAVNLGAILASPVMQDEPSDD
jgi:hypothetical protein